MYSGHRNINFKTGILCTFGVSSKSQHGCRLTLKVGVSCFVKQYAKCHSPTQSLLASLIRSVGGFSQCFYQDLYLIAPSADVIDQSINRHGVAYKFPHYGMVCSSFSAGFLYGFSYRFERPWAVIWSMRQSLNGVRVGAWNTLLSYRVSNKPVCSHVHLSYPAVFVSSVLRTHVNQHRNRKSATEKPDQNSPVVR